MNLGHENLPHAVEIRRVAPFIGDAAIGHIDSPSVAAQSPSKGVSLGKMAPSLIVEEQLPPDYKVENTLRYQFSDAVEQLDFAATAIIAEGRKTPKSIEEFRFVPITGLFPDHAKTMDSPGHNIQIPAGIRASYSSPHPKPFLDTQLAIGMVKGDWLVALASAGVEGTSTKVVQIQDVSGVTTRRGASSRDRYRTGLHDGILWRDTLVTAWERVTLATGASNEVVIQGGCNNHYDIVRKHRFHHAYDGVAKRMGYLQQPNGNWIKSF